ncbi:hypothetical protein OJ996_14860 [Luteolibacter sp. GHJ8]|uniref:Uncharacterized protein n=1 Tax=Luteolibacter rhizosphaerae TaxID=2989719 RepID=A0ABT3G5U1_9BACT|nr:hypothetical protein [Luteolibacter rhizosphaerae]MCW1914866.1 hypothetical protein [Luteolibacter rhizosphaerae]
MSDAAEKFIAAAVTPLRENAEMQTTAERELRGMMEGREISAEVVEEAGRQVGPRRRWGRPVVGVMLAVSLLLGGVQVFRLVQQRELIRAFLDLEYPAEFPESFAKRNATAGQLLLIADDTGALLASDPDNAAYLADHCRFLLTQGRKELHAGLLKTAGEIDPENGYFLYLAANQAAKKCVKSIPGPRRKKGEPLPIEQWKIEDEARFEEALSLLKKAVALPKWESYRGEIAQARFEALESPRDLVDGMGKALLQSRLDRRPIDSTSYVIAAKAEQCGLNGDREGLRELALIWEALARRQLELARPGLLDGLFIGGDIVFPISNLRDAASKLGESELEARFRRLREAYDHLSRQRRESPAGEARNDTIEHRGAYLAAVAPLESFGPSDAPAIQDEELKPGRLADYALMDSWLALTGWVMLGLASLTIALYRFRGGLFARKMSCVLSGLIRPGDHAWIFAGGILFPMVCLLLLSRLTDLGCRQWNGGLHGMAVPVGQFLATLLIIMGLPILIARRQLRKRAGFLGLCETKSWAGWLAVPMGIAAIVIYGLSIPAFDPKTGAPDGLINAADFIDLDITEAEGLPRTLLFTATGGVAAGLIWLIGAGMRALFSSHARLLERCVLSRVVIPAYLGGMVLMATMAMLHHAEERYWVKQDRWMAVSAETAPRGSHEHWLATSYFERLREALDGRIETR